MSKDKMSLIYELMPTSWKEAAKEKEALVRSRNITSGDSYGLTSALTQFQKIKLENSGTETHN